MPSIAVSVRKPIPTYSIRARDNFRGPYNIYREFHLVEIINISIKRILVGCVPIMEHAVLLYLQLWLGIDKMGYLVLAYGCWRRMLAALNKYLSYVVY